MTGLQYVPQLAYVSGGGAAARSFAEGLVTMYLVMFAVWIIGRAAWKAHKRGLARVRRFNQRHAPKHARRVK
jgi:hypothetical protein